VADGIRLESAEAVRLLKRMGLNHMVMLTGDRTAVAQRVAQQVGIETYQAELLPEDKLNAIQYLRRFGAEAPLKQPLGRFAADNSRPYRKLSL
jgi:Cd2+/Zn2+-exporting ATPase